MRIYYINKMLELENVYLDYPFDVANWATLRHCDNKKIFAIVFDHNGYVCINFKNTPEWAIFWRETFESVTPAYHMNKEHWSTVIVGGDADEDRIMQMIYDSYKLTLKKTRNKK